VRPQRSQSQRLEHPVRVDEAHLGERGEEHTLDGRPRLRREPAVARAGVAELERDLARRVRGEVEFALPAFQEPFFLEPDLEGDDRGSTVVPAVVLVDCWWLGVAWRS